MFQFLSIFGPAAVTYLTVSRCLNRVSCKGMEAFIRLICYGAIDFAITIICMRPLDKIKTVVISNGMSEIQYGNTAFLFSMAAAVVSGIVIAAIQKRIEFHIEISACEDGKDE